MLEIGTLYQFVVIFTKTLRLVSDILTNILIMIEFMKNIACNFFILSVEQRKFAQY